MFLSMLFHILGPALLDVFTLSSLVSFIVCAAALRSDIILAQPMDYHPDVPPDHLPDRMIIFFTALLNTSDTVVNLAWTSLKGLIWDKAFVAQLKERGDLTMARHGGSALQLVCDTFSPPQLYCTDTRPHRHYLRRPLRRVHKQEVVLFTLDRGTVPACAESLRCEECHTSYHHNFQVQGRERTYYPGVPEVLEIGEHQFIEKRLVDMWIALMVHAWTSASNCARIYNSTRAHATYTHGFPWSPFIDTEQVWDSFVLLALLQEFSTQRALLRVPHDGRQESRFTLAMQERNMRCQQNGLPHVCHWCYRCVRVIDERSRGGELATISASVVDGITLGYPCCAHFNCKIPLASTRHRYCPTHESQDGVQCAIIGCSNPICPGSKVCNVPAHVGAERRYLEEGKAMFVLQRRMERMRNSSMAGLQYTAHSSATPSADQTQRLTQAPTGQHFVVNSGDDPSEELEGVDGIEEFLLTPSGPAALTDSSRTCVGVQGTGVAAQNATSPPSGQRIRAQFGRKRTHNEQIVVSPCGIILGRSTFFGAEGLNTVAEFIEKIYRNAPRPNFIFFDNNCQLAQTHYVKCSEWWKRISLPVDVFHFQCKHSERDEFCQSHCNPALFADLRMNGKWFFNSSAAEQTNAWLGGFRSMCREMSRDKFNFFIDEVITRRNAFTIDKLQREGHSPQYWSNSR